MKRQVFSFLLLAVLTVSLFAVLPVGTVYAQCGSDPKAPPCPPPDGGKHKKPTPTPYPSYTPAPAQAAVATQPPVVAPADNPAPPDIPVTGQTTPSLMDFIRGHIVLDGILIALLVGVLIGLSRGILIGLNRGRAGMGDGSVRVADVNGDGKLLPAVDRANRAGIGDGSVRNVDGIVAPTENVAGIVAPTENVAGMGDGSVRNVNGDLPPASSGGGGGPGIDGISGPGQG